MKHLFTILLALLTVGFNKAQMIADSVSMLTNYSNQVFYSLDNGIVSSVNNNDWSIAFSVSGNGAAGSAVLLNEATSTLWAYPGDTASWNSFDTTGCKNWKRLLNSDTSWTNGAFNIFRGAGGIFDMGWGILNPLNNYWTFGDSLYLIKLSDNSFRKLWIVSLKSGVWNIKYANLDGSNLQLVTLNKSSFTNKNFAYVSLITNTVIDKEPSNTTWDLTFYKHVDLVSNQYVSVTSTFTNKKVWTAKSNVVNYTAAVSASAPISGYSKRINSIGREWKNYSSSTGWRVYDSIAYFVYDNDSTNLYRIVFTKFGGASTGKTYFVKQNLGYVGMNENSKKLYSVKIFPCPFTYQLNIQINNCYEKQAIIEVYNIGGGLIERKNFEITPFGNPNTLNTESWSSGLYFIKVITSTEETQIKLVKE